MRTLPCVVALLVLGAYAVLLPAGRWQADEYLVSWQVAQQGWAVFLDRVQGWSPRPIAEFVTFLYFVLANALNRPFMGYYLAFLWVVSLGLVIAAGWAGRVRQPVRLAVVLLALTLLLAKPGEMFYWPMGASAYLPCWAGLAAASVLHRGRAERNGVALWDVGLHGGALAVGLLVAAFSAEVGALTVLVYGLLVAAAAWRERSLLSGLVPVVLPALGAVAVCLTVLGHRGQAQEVFDPASGLAGHWLGSVAASVPRFAREALGVSGMPLLVGLAIKTTLLVSLPVEAAGTVRGRRLGALWAVALLVGAFGSIVMAYHQFGVPCCERHATLRQAMILLA
ncbi:MAG TPA: hypothetical protein VFG12_06030, partial [Rhodopila sp.]|nr:hypothetical protein [Rhodopila sp.]